MNKLLSIITGSIARSYEGKTYYRVSALGTDSKVYSFTSAVEPTLKSVAIISHYPEGAIVPWTGNKAERAFTVCESITSKDTMTEAKELAADLAGIEL